LEIKGIVVDELLYCRGYLLTQESTGAAPQTFLHAVLPNGLNFYHHPAFPVCLSGSGQNWVLLGGRAIDVLTGQAQLADIACSLYSKILAGEESFFDALDVLSGRFIVIYAMQGKVSVLHDACGLKTVFYATDRLVVGSHASLVDKLVGLGDSDVAVSKPDGLAAKGYPGCETPYRNVRMLTPNTLLELSSRRVRRYFPREDLTAVTIRDAAGGIMEAMRKQLDVLLGNGKVLASLTAGLDSRVALATARERVGEMQFFTYRKPDSAAQDVDVAVSRQIADLYHLDHRVIDIKVPPEAWGEYKQIQNVLLKNTYAFHARALAFLYWNLFRDQDVIHVRSNLAEIGRSFYKKGKDLPALSEPSALAKLYSPEFWDMGPIADAFRDFWDLSEFDKLYNYDSYDMYYWEHRMGCWHSHVLIESDVAFDTHILFNARHILKLMLAVPLTDRAKGTVFRAMIDENLLEIKDLPVNPKSWPV
jgi:hypothetical protein